jgi:Holliday junction resolvase RusA-like endonuclease
MINKMTTNKVKIYGHPPSKANSYKIRGNSLGKAQKVVEYEEAFRLQVNAIRSTGLLPKGCIVGMFAINIDVYYKDKRSDLDNSAKVILDCLQANQVIDNDRNCIRLVLNKKLDKEQPRIEFEIIF